MIRIHHTATRFPRHSVSRGAIFEPLEQRQLMAADVRSIDGSGNNLVNTQWGSTDETLLRLTPAAYEDGLSAPAGADRPSARVVSNTVADHGDDEILNERNLSAYAYLWGQFIDHDLGLTTSATPKESLNITVPTGDPYFDPNATGTQVIGFSRSEYAQGSGETTPRQQLNDITSFIDASMIYGSDAVRAAALRTGSGGLMKTSDGDLLPFNTAGLPNDTVGGPASAYFLAGDVRANENIELTSLQTLFVREHNRIARSIARANPALSDEAIYQQAKKLVTAEVQVITYNEYLPALMGPGSIRPYAGYRANVNPGLSTEFSTAAFRLGHSMLVDDVEFMDNNGVDVREEISLAEAFFNPAIVSETGLDPILKYLASSNSEELDTKVVGSLRNFLFGQPGSGGFDLVSLNVQRGRDHGLSDYNTTRATMGLPKVTDFSQITSDTDLQTSLRTLYGSVDKIDLWVGGLAEDHLPGSSLGPTFQRIVADQFTRVRDGDRFWYSRDLSPSELRQVQGTKLSDVIRRNSGVYNLQDNVFVFSVQINGQVFNDRNGDGRPSPREPGLAGRQVNLVDSDGVVVQSTVADGRGRYHFEDVQIGQYQVRVELPAGWRSPFSSRSIAVTRGQVFNGVDFAQQTVRPPPRNPLPPPPRAGAPAPTSLGGPGLSVMDSLHRRRA